MTDEDGYKSRPRVPRTHTHWQSFTYVHIRDMEREKEKEKGFTAKTNGRSEFERCIRDTTR